MCGYGNEQVRSTRTRGGNRCKYRNPTRRSASLARTRAEPYSARSCPSQLVARPAVRLLASHLPRGPRPAHPRAGRQIDPSNRARRDQEEAHDWWRDGGASGSVGLPGIAVHAACGQQGSCRVPSPLVNSTHGPRSLLGTRTITSFRPSSDALDSRRCELQDAGGRPKPSDTAYDACSSV